MKPTDDYPDLYLKTDIFLLAYVFENFRESCHLEPTVYVSVPGLSWDAALWRSKEAVDLLSEVDMYLIS